MLGKMLQRLHSLTVTGLGLGYMPVAPGTFGTLLGIPLALGLGVMLQRYGLMWTATCFSALWAGALACVALYEQKSSVHDARHIVLDEVLGYGVIYLFVPIDLFTLAWGFLWFRFFDILKHGLVGWVEEKFHGHAFGTMADDLVAGLCAVPAILVAHYMIFYFKLF